MVEQLQLLIRDSQKKVSIDVITSQPTFKDALKLCKSISGLDDKQICMTLDIDPAQWSRIWGNGGHFPENKLIQFMQICQNIVPLIWLAYSCGYTLHPLKTELELENEKLKAEITRMENEREIEKRTIAELLRNMGGK